MSKEEQIPCPLPLPVLSLDHVSLLCKSVTASTEFYENVLGFQLVRRPSSFNFVGAWLFNYGVGIHLLQCKSVDDLPKKTEINPRDNHISFQCADMFLVEKGLQEMDIKYKKRVVEDGGLYVDQLFFHDPDGYMIEICNCENLPLIPVQSTSSKKRSNHSSSRELDEKEKAEENPLGDMFATASNRVLNSSEIVYEETEPSARWKLPSISASEVYSDVSAFHFVAATSIR